MKRLPQDLRARAMYGSRSAKTAPSMPVIGNMTSKLFGDPAPGRSVLDQERAQVIHLPGVWPIRDLRVSDSGTT